MDIGAEHIAGGLLVLAQQRRAGEAEEKGIGQPALHLLVHVAALSAVALVHEYVETSMNRGRLALEIGRIELVDKCTQQAWHGGSKLLHEVRPRGDARRGRFRTYHPGVTHHAFDLLVQLVTVGHYQHPGLRVMFQQPLGQQHHQNALAATLGVPDHPAFSLCEALLSGLYALVLVLPWHLLEARVEDHEVAEQIQQPLLAAHLGQRAIQQGACDYRGLRLFIFPLYEELLRRAGGAIAQALRVATRQQQLNGAEETWLNTSSWLLSSWRIPSPTSTELRLSSSTTARPLI